MKRIFFIFLLLVSGELVAQDTLKMVNQAVYVVKIVEIGLEEVKYRPWGMEDAPIIVVEKKDIREIVFANGDVMKIEPEPLLLANMLNKAQGKKNAFKIEFLAPVTNNFTVCYERVIKPSVNIETKLGIIGIGVSKVSTRKPSGLFTKCGVKFWSGSDYYVRGTRMSHPLRGAYVKPEIIFSQFRQTESWYNYAAGNTISGRYSYTSLALNICFGKQVLLADIMTLDWYFGIGYGLQMTNAPEYSSNYYGDLDKPFAPYAYSHLFLGRNFPMVFSGGMTIGVLFK